MVSFYKPPTFVFPSFMPFMFVGFFLFFCFVFKLNKKGEMGLFSKELDGNQVQIFNTWMF